MSRSHAAIVSDESHSSRIVDRKRFLMIRTLLRQRSAVQLATAIDDKILYLDVSDG